MCQDLFDSDPLRFRRIMQFSPGFMVTLAVNNAISCIKSNIRSTRCWGVSAMSSRTCWSFLALRAMKTAFFMTGDKVTKQMPKIAVGPKITFLLAKELILAWALLFISSAAWPQSARGFYFVLQTKKNCPQKVSSISGRQQYCIAS